MEKKKTLILVITSLFLLIVILSASYAYFSIRISVGNTLPVSINVTNSSVAFTSVVQQDGNMTIYASDLLSASTTAVKSSQGIINVNLLSGEEGMAAKCTYDIIWQWTGKDIYTESSAGELPYTDDTGTYNFEYSIKGSRVNANDSSGRVYTNKDVEETDLSKFTWETGNNQVSALIVDDAEIYNNSATIATNTTWTFDFQFYSLPVSQRDLLDKNLSGQLLIKNVVCS